MFRPLRAFVKIPLEDATSALSDLLQTPFEAYLEMQDFGRCQVKIITKHYSFYLADHSRIKIHCSSN